LQTAEHKLEIKIGSPTNKEDFITLRKLIAEISGNQELIDSSELLENQKTILNVIDQVFFLGFVSEDPVGYLQLNIDKNIPGRKVGKIKIGLLKEYDDEVRTKKLLQKAQTYGIEEDLQRMEILVSTSNFNEVNQLVQMGFQIDGKTRSLHTENTEDSKQEIYLMAKML